MKSENTLTQKSSSITTISLVQMALMIAITCVATMVIKIPTLFGIGYDHLGDSMVFFGAILFGKKKGALTAAVAMSLADLLLGYAYYVPFTFIIKGLMAYIAASIAYRGTYEGKNMFNNILGFILGGAWMVFGYFLAKIVVVQYIVVKATTFKQAFFIALAGIQGNITQVTVGMLIAIPLVKILQPRLKIQR